MNDSPFKVDIKPFNKEVLVPSSKSHANRALVMAAICPDPVSIQNLPESTDVTTLLDCFEKIGLEIKSEKNKLIIVNSFPACEEFSSGELIKLETKDGGTTNRFLLALLSRGKKKYILNASLGLRVRPHQDLFEILRDLSVKINVCNQPDCWLEIQGPYNLSNAQKTLEIDSTISTQFVSALSMSLSDHEIEVQAKNLVTSKDYYQMTLSYIDRLKKGERDFYIPIDFSGASYPLALGVSLGHATLSGQNQTTQIDPYQADSQLISILKNHGARIVLDNNKVQVWQSKLRAMKLNCVDYPDLVPTLMFLASYHLGPSLFKGISVLRHKECDRLQEMFSLLSLFKVDFNYDKDKDELTIQGETAKLTEVVSHRPFADHRMVMVTYLFMRLNRGGDIYNYQCVDKSFPDFFEQME